MLSVWFVLSNFMSQSTVIFMLRQSVHPDTHFFLGKLDYGVNQYFVHILSLVTDTTLLESEGGGE